MLKNSIKALAAGAVASLALSSSAFAGYGHGHAHRGFHAHHVYKPVYFAYHKPVCVKYGWAVDYHGHKKWVCLHWK